MENIIKELRELGADVELNSDKLLTLNGDWTDTYNEYHEHFSIITGYLYTYNVQHKDFLSNLTNLGRLDTSDSVQHKDFLPNLTNLGYLDTPEVVQHKDFLKNLTSLGDLYTYKSVQHKDFLKNLTSLVHLDTSDSIQHKDFLPNLTNLGYLDTYNVVQHKDFLSNLTNLGTLYTPYTKQDKDFLSNLTNLGTLDTSDSVQHKDFLPNLTSLGRLDTYNSVQHKDFLPNLTSLGRLDTYYAEQHKDFLQNLTRLGRLYTYNVQHKDFLSNLTIGDVELPYIYKDEILSKVLTTKIVDGITVHSTNRVGYTDIEYVVVDGEYSAHASTIKMALIDLNFKKSDRNVSWLEDKSVNDVLNFEDSILAYRCVTGACTGGIESFIKSIKEKDEYKISEIIELTKDQYGNKEFEIFFIK